MITTDSVGEEVDRLRAYVIAERTLTNIINLLRPYEKDSDIGEAISLLTWMLDEATANARVCVKEIRSALSRHDREARTARTYLVELLVRAHREFSEELGRMPRTARGKYHACGPRRRGTVKR